MDTIKNINFILSLSWLVLALCLSIFVFGFFNENEPFKEESGEACGTKSTLVSSSLPDSIKTSLRLGKELFKMNCASCHNQNMRQNLTGPALAGTRERWAAYPKEDLYNWIRNSQKLVEEQHPRALKLIEEWNGVMMNSFPNLSDQDIESLLDYIELY